MADESKLSLEGLKKFKNRVVEGDLNPGNLATKLGSKEAVSNKANEIQNFLNKIIPNAKKNPKEFEEWKSIKRIIDRKFKVAESYSLNPKITPSSEELTNLADKGYTKISAKNTLAKAIEDADSSIDPLVFKNTQIQTKTQVPKIKNVNPADIGEFIPKKGLKTVSGALPLLGGALAFSQASEAGARVPEALIKATQEETTSPIVDALLPSSISEDKPLTDQQIAQYQAEMRAKSDETRRKNEERQANASEFGEKFNKMQQAKRNALKKMSERQ